MSRLSHLDESGRARMVDVTDKPVTARRAAAEGRIRRQAATLALVREVRAPTGSVASTAALAGGTAAQRTGDPITLSTTLPHTGHSTRSHAGSGKRVSLGLATWAS